MFAILVMGLVWVYIFFHPPEEEDEWAYKITLKNLERIGLMMIGYNMHGYKDTIRGLVKKIVNIGQIRLGNYKVENDKYSEQKMKLRQETLAILMKNFDDNKSIYECADEWVSKQVTTAGLVSYYKAYYTAK